MRVRETVASTVATLSAGGISEYDIEGEVLVRFVLGMDRARLFASWDEPLTPYQESQVARLAQRRLQGEPLAYITGHREFYGLDFMVTPDVLIPRQESEVLVDKVLELLSVDGRRGPVTIADVGTGSGAIAIALAHNLPNVSVIATDVSRDALGVADANRRRHGVQDSVHLCQSDLLEALRSRVDVVVSNPPYIRTSEIDRLAPEVRREPARALDGGADGLDVTGRLIKRAPRYLAPGGSMLVEIASDQVEDLFQQAREAMPDARVSFADDPSGLPRVMIVKAHGRPAWCGSAGSLDLPPMVESYDRVRLEESVNG